LGGGGIAAYGSGDGVGREPEFARKRTRMYDAILCIAQSAFTSMKAITTSFRLPPELRQRLEETARRLGRGKNWIIVQALKSI
jgi:hypothetical protein